MTLYRKYRPQTIAELDLEDIRKRLSLVLSSGHIPHAFLFAGPKGTGKTSAARIIAKVLNCEKTGKKLEEVSGADRFKVKFEPCNSCDMCVSITNGRNLDVLEIDAASNRGIDEIRDLREKIKLAPTSARYKVYIIDEVHMLTTEAFNALLKTLEEPPTHAIFILATTEPDRLLPTIISRCSRFDFKKATEEELVHSLERVAKGEALKIHSQKEFLEVIARASEGSFRDATKFLEQAMAEDSLEPEKLQNIIGGGTKDAILVIDKIAKKDAKTALDVLEEASKRGVNMKFLTANILNRLHDLLMAKHGLKDKSSMESELAVLTHGDINKLIRLFSRVYQEERSVVIPELPLELAVIEWCEGTRES